MVSDWAAVGRRVRSYQYGIVIVFLLVLGLVLMMVRSEKDKIDVVSIEPSKEPFAALARSGPWFDEYVFYHVTHQPLVRVGDELPLIQETSDVEP